MDIALTGAALRIVYCHPFFHTAGWGESKAWPEHSLYIVRSGCLAVRTQDGTHYARGGDVILLLPEVRIQVEALEDTWFLLAGFHLETGGYQELFGHLGGGALYGGGMLAQSAQMLFRAVWLDGQNPTLFSPRQYAAFFTFLADLTQCFGAETVFSPAVRRTSDQKLRALVHRMEAECPRMLTIGALAAQMGMSEKYFLQYFHQSIGCTPRQYMNRLRMHHAARLLSDPSLTLDEIAHRMQFSDQYAFSKAFRKYYGEPPGSFREQLGQASVRNG